MTENSQPENTRTRPGPESQAGAAGPTATPPRPPLRRSRTDRKIAGVCGGLGRYTDIDPLVFRIVVVVLAVFGGSGLLLYALAWLLVPDEGEQESEAQRLMGGRGTSAVLGAILLAVVGVVAFGQLVGTGFGFGGVAALAALAVAALLMSRSDHGVGRGDQPATGATTATGATGAYGQTPGTAYTSVAPGPPGGSPPLATGPSTGPSPGPPPPPYVPPPGAYYGPPPPPPSPPRERSPLGRVTVSAVLLVAGLIIGWDAATSYDVPAAIVLAACVVTVGVGLIVGAFVGRARGLIFLGAVLVLFTTGAAAADAPIRGGVGDRRWAPLTVADVHSPYRLGAGDARLDLSDLTLPAGETLRVRASVGAGELVVLVPDAVSLEVDAHSGVGHIELPDGSGREGVDSTTRWSDPGNGSAGLIELDAEVGVGNLEVHRATP